MKTTTKRKIINNLYVLMTRLTALFILSSFAWGMLELLIIKSVNHKEIVMNTQRFIVEIVTSDKITDDSQIDEMAQNIADAIREKCNHSFIVPEDSDAHTTIVYVKGWYSDKQVIEHIY